MSFDEEHINRLIHHYKYVAKSRNTHSQATCTVAELNTAIDETAKLIVEIAKMIQSN